MVLTDEQLRQRQEELLRRYQNGERDFTQVALDGGNYDLRGVTLAGANFSGTFITADFRGANLQAASFAKANVKTCDFRHADLRGANFSGALLEATEFKGANLRDANFEDARNFSLILKAGELPTW